ncbi:MAG: helix-turn-helix domain-containing protein [Magnetospiraceae bacterium]
MSRRKPRTSPDPIDKYVGSRVRGRRLGLRMSQTKLGEAIGVTFQQVQKYENGTNRIGASNLFKIAKTLGVEPDYFFQEIPDSTWKSTRRGKGASDTGQAEFEQDPLSSRESIELTHNYFRIPDEQVRKRLFQFVRSLAEGMAAKG